eukprot:m51a1_g4714 hypothetical protein (187) ;mRNA; f:298759-299624
MEAGDAASEEAQPLFGPAARTGPAPAGWEASDEPRVAVVAPGGPRAPLALPLPLLGRRGRRAAVQIAITCFWTPGAAAGTRVAVTHCPGYGLLAEGSEQATLGEVYEALLARMGARANPFVRVELLRLTAADGSALDAGQRVGRRAKFRMVMVEHVDFGLALKAQQQRQRQQQEGVGAGRCSCSVL